MKKIVLKVADTFAEFVVPNVSRNYLVLLNGHSTHTKKPEALQLALDSGAKTVSLPEHTTHRLQSVDLAFLRTLSSQYIAEIGKWLHASPGRCDTHTNVTVL